MDLVQPESLGMNARQLARIGEHMRRRYVEPGKIPGCLTMVSRRGEVCYVDVAGLSDVARNTPLTSDTIMRIYSMTKPITSVALMTLYEKGLFSLSDPVHRYIPTWKNMRVRKGGAWPLFETEPCKRPMTIRDLFMHTSGLTYGFLRASNIDRAYRKQGVGDPRPGYTLKDMMDQLAELPLEFSPGERWNYSVSTDVLAYLVEVISGKSFEDYLQEVILGPLGMVDTGFNIPAAKLARFGSCYQRNMAKELVLQDDGQDSEYRDRALFSGGGGLLSTLGDYNRFCQMLLNGGTLDAQRIIGPRTLAFMTGNHLPGGVDMSAFATGSFSETGYEGVGFGLGFANKLNALQNGFPASNGSFFWGGLASTLFWVDPVEELVVIFMTQLIPSSTFNFRGQLEALVYAALD
ncbi:MAG: beta-lactamase family protein [Proteobacteria bacterium]|nr:beta-lactamase family protein [Pseudomonadota bacterium]